MVKSKNFSGLAKALYILPILLCVGATTSLIIMHAPKKPFIAASDEMSDEVRRGEEILNTVQNSPENIP